jgi:hypothetical protein
MKIIKLVRNSAGIGLVEVMMAVAVTGGLTLTIAKLMDNATQSAKQVEAKTENTNLKGLVQDVLNNTTACKNTFGPVMTAANITALSGSSTATVNLPNIKDKLNVIKYSTASTNISPLTITSMELTNYNALAFTGDVIINSTFKKSVNNVVMVKPIRIPINFSFNGGSLTACSTMAVGGEWLLGGNAGTVDGSDYIGTSDDTPFNIKVNAQKSGRIDTIGQTYFGYKAGMNQTSNNGTAFGYQASMYNTSGTGNSAFGWGSLFSNVSTNNNTAIGNRALFLTSTSGSNNTAIGADTLLMNTSGRGNFAGGAFSLENNKTGSWNTAVGLNSLSFNSSGEFNSAFGAEALRNNNYGSSNTASGFGAMAYATSGSSNTAIGKGAFSYSTSGSLNTALGVNALYRTSGSNNTALGSEALGGNTGDNNSALGYLAGYASSIGSNNLYLGTKSGTGSTGSNKLYIETNGNTNPLIGGDFSSAGRYVTINNKLGIGLPIGTIPVSKLAIGNSGGSNNETVTVTRDTMGSGNALYAKITPYPDSNTYIAVHGSCNPATTVSSYCHGVYGFGGYPSPTGGGRSYGVKGQARNGTAGWNYGVYGVISGTSMGAGVFGTTSGDIDMTTFTGVGTASLAGFFHGDTYTSGTVKSLNAFNNVSDRRLKKDIKTLDNGLEKILKLRGVSYYWKKDNHTSNWKNKQIGLIAQEVEEQYPELVSTNKNLNGEEAKMLSYGPLVAPIIEAIKELYAKFLLLVQSDGKQNLEIKELKLENEKLKLEMKKQQESFDLRMKKLEAQSAKK